MTHDSVITPRTSSLGRVQAALAGILLLFSTQCSSGNGSEGERTERGRLSSPPILLVSTLASRASPVSLNGATVTGTAYVFTSDSTSSPMPSGIQQVRYWLDNPQMTGAPTHVENYAPYDFAGTVSDSVAIGWDTTTVADGLHTISQSVTTASGSVQTSTASFSVGASSCIPTTCAAQGKNCGSISDGCGGTLSCGTCTSPQTCGGGGTANVCGGGASGAAYYVDFLAGDDTRTPAQAQNKATPWKHIKGMTGCTSNCASASLMSGDRVIFKGGVTWTKSYPWSLVGIGPAGVTYTTDRTWFAGASFTQPVFDDEHAAPGATGMASLDGGGFVTLNDLKFVSCGAPQVANENKCLVFSNTHDVAITNSTFATESWISIYFVFTSSGSRSNFTLTGNDFSHTSGAVWFASAASGAQEHDIRYDDNTFHDYASQIGGGVHGDGALHFYVIPGNDGTQFADNFTFCNNRFYGDFRRSFGSDGAMTGLFFVEGGLSGVVCNNDMGFSPSQANMFQGLIVLQGEDNPKSGPLRFYGNSLVNAGTNAMSAAIDIAYNYRNVALENNIASGMQYAVYVEDAAGSGATLTTDYNLWNSTSGQLVWGSAFQYYAQWKAAGRDTHGILGSDPAWVGAPNDLHLTASSPARNAGVNLGALGISILDADKDGRARPSGTAAWDIGAHQF